MHIELEGLSTNNDDFLELVKAQKAFQQRVPTVELVDIIPLTQKSPTLGPEDAMWQVPLTTSENFSEALLATRRMVVSPVSYPRPFQKK